MALGKALTIFFSLVVDLDFEFGFGTRTIPSPKFLFFEDYIYLFERERTRETEGKRESTDEWWLWEGAAEGEGKADSPLRGSPTGGSIPGPSI